MSGSRVEVKTLYIEPGSPWENGYNESFNGTLGEEVLKREILLVGGGESATEQFPTPQLAPLPTTRPRSARPDPFFLNLPKLNGPHPRLQEAVGLTQ